MRTKLTALLLVLFAGVFSTDTLAQVSEECRATLSLFVESAKVKNYTAARPHFDNLRKDCPNASLAIYQYGDKILKDDLKKATGDKTAAVNAIIELYDQRLQYFGAKTKKGEYQSKKAQLLYDNKIGSTKTQYDAFHKAWTEDKATVKSSKSIYTYFKLAVDLFDQGQYPLQSVFDLYDDVQDKLSQEGSLIDAKLQKLLDKEEAGQDLTAKEKKAKNRYETNLKAFGTFASSVDGKLGKLADCENLIPLYNKDFEEKKNDINWINKAASRMLSKECTDDPLFKRLVEQLHALQPSADSAKYLMILCAKSGDSACEKKYFEQALTLETDPTKRAELNYRKAESYRKAGSYGQARTFYNKALADNPSMGKCYLRIAAMYAASANNCGTSVFDKRATYWLAADVAARAGRVSPRLAGNANATASSYRAKAPDRSMIFNENKTSVTLKCWIGRTVKVPKI